MLKIIHVVTAHYIQSFEVHARRGNAVYRHGNIVGLNPVNELADRKLDLLYDALDPAALFLVGPVRLDVARFDKVPGGFISFGT